jgi:HEAT repeat protein
MAPAKNFDAELAAVNAAADLSPEEALPILRKALAHRNNLIVSRAARHAGKLQLTSLLPDLVAAFHRFMPPNDAIKTDPQCWAKNDISKTLAQFEAQEPELFLSGVRHHQYEPTWGGPSDSAGALRGTCALALVQCRELSSPVLLRYLTPLFADKDKTVRMNGARAIEQVGSDSAALLLRLRAELGSDEPELLGACLGGVLRLDGESTLPWVAAFLTEQDDLSAETAFVLAEHRLPAAIPYLQRAYNTAREPAFRNAIIAALASMRLPEATTWLLAQLAERNRDAPTIAASLWDSAPSEETAKQLIALGYKLTHSNRESG